MRCQRVGAVMVALVLATVGAATPARASRTWAPAGFDDSDEAAAAEAVDEGLGEGAALFLALTTVDRRALGGHRVRITERFPTGNRAVIDVGVVATDVGEPGPPIVKAHTSGGAFVFALEYFVPYSAIPTDVQPTFQGVSDVRSVPASALAGYSRVAAPGTEQSGVRVVVKAVVSKFVNNRVADFVKFVDGKIGEATVLDPLVKKLKAAVAVDDAMALSAEVEELMRRIDALEKCVKSPTNPLTKKAYKRDPAEQDRLLAQIAATREQVTQNAAVGFVGMLNKAASAPIKGAPWLGYVVGAGTAWSKETLHQVNQGLVDDLTKSIVPCTLDYKIDAEAYGQRWTATKCGGVAGQWDVSITSDVQYPTQGSFTFESEPEEGGTVNAQTALIDFEQRIIEGRYSESFSVTFHAGGAGVAPSFGIDEELGGAVIPVMVGDFCER